MWQERRTGREAETLPGFPNIAPDTTGAAATRPPHTRTFAHTVAVAAWVQVNERPSLRLLTMIAMASRSLMGPK